MRGALGESAGSLYSRPRGHLFGSLQEAGGTSREANQRPRLAGPVSPLNSAPLSLQERLVEPAVPGSAKTPRGSLLSPACTGEPPARSKTLPQKREKRRQAEECKLRASARLRDPSPLSLACFLFLFLSCYLPRRTSSPLSAPVFHKAPSLARLASS